MGSISPLYSSSIFTERCYRDARAAITFLDRAFGFTPSLVVPGDVDVTRISHAELWAGRGCVMIASIDSEGPWNYRVPSEIGGINTGAPYLATADIDALYTRAKNAGASIVSDLADTDYGSRDFSACDLEGFLWQFGTYRPLTGPTGAAPEPDLFAGNRYLDARAAMTWLGRAFGATEQFVVPGKGDEIAHAQLLLDESIFMLGTGRTDEFYLKTPAQIDGAYTQTLNVCVADPDAHCARATAAGAEILRPLADTPYGARGYVTRDCEGYVWGFSTYRPVPPVRVDATAISG